MLQNQQILQDRYQLQRLLGQNAGRETWLALDCQTQTLVVVKLLTLSDRMEWDQLRLFEREAQTLKHLSHPQIPQYQDFFCLDDRLLWFALVQNYIPGHSLKHLLEQGKVFDEAEVRQIARQILKILIELHGLSPPVLHRDIKPSNLILNEIGTVYLIDFGAVQDRVAKEGATFTVVGTYGYAPLEQLGGRATPASDLYALGATLIHLLTGVAPANLPQADGRLQFANLVNLNPGFVRWLWRLTEVNADLRFPTARDALQALQNNALRNNEAAIALTGATKLEYSEIQLRKSPQQLEISIKKNGFAFATDVRFDSQQFEICWTWCGFSRRQQGRITDIDRVSKGELRGIQKTFPAVKITIGVHESLITSIDPPLAEADRDWLLQEIRQWLGLE
jgi:serine/threonine protein kinase